MDKTIGKAGVAAAIGAALLAGCASMDAATAWNMPPAGSTWQMTQKNTGSFGKDAELTMTISDTEWQGQKAVKMTNTATGGSIVSLPNGKWIALVTKEGKAAVTYDPPQGYESPMKVGQAWKTHHRATNHLTGKSAEYDYDCKVEARENVTVRAGTFSAFRIACENEISRDLTWFVPEIGMHAKTDMRRKAAAPSGEGTQQSELVAYRIAR